MKKNTKTESDLSSMEVMLTSLGDSSKTEVDMIAFQAKKGDTLAELCQNVCCDIFM